jgi:hypothetical protein
MAEYVPCLLSILSSLPRYPLLSLPIILPSFAFPPSFPPLPYLPPPSSSSPLRQTLLTPPPFPTSWMAQSSANTKDFVVGQYVSNRAQGLRSFPYSTSATTNPLRYSSLQQLTEVHDIGEVWANMLHQVYAALVAARGFSNRKLTDADGKEGNVVFMRVMMDALAIQPCNPTCAFRFPALFSRSLCFLYFYSPSLPLFGSGRR